MMATADLASSLPSDVSVVDSHVHLTSARISYRDDVAGLIKDCSVALAVANGDIDENQYRKAIEGVPIAAAVFVEVLPTAETSMDEACWVRDLILSGSSMCKAIVASMPVPSGAENVHQWLRTLRARVGHDQETYVKGARMQFPPGEAGDSVLRSDELAAGLAALAEHDLLFEFCVHADRLPAVVDVAKRSGATRLVLDHCGLNDSGQAFADWQRDLAALASCPNVVVKLSALEEWQPVNGDPGPYLDHALRCFGAERCMFGGNWFVPVAFDNRPYATTVVQVAAALGRAGASDEEKRAVWGGTARRVYKLGTMGRDM